jgi:hypothetical protein
VTSSLLDVRHGSRTPRVSNYRRGRTSAGQDAVDLAASAGLVLDPWQQDVLIAALAEGRSGRWVSSDVGLVVPRQNGKGTILEARELAGLFLFGESILHTSHEFKTSMDHYRRIESLIRQTPDLHRKVQSYPKAPGTEGVVLRTGQALRFMARTKGAGRGFPADMVVYDEAFALTDDQIAALMPTMQARPNPQAWYTSSPPLDGVSGEPLFALRARGELPGGSDGLCWFDWGAEIGVDPDDREAWYASNPAMGYRISEQSMARLRQVMAPEGFARECLGVWPRTTAEAWLVIGQNDWIAAVDEESSAEDPVAFAVTLSTDRQWCTITAAGRRADGLFHVTVVDRRQGTGWVIPRLIELVEKWRPIAVVIDKGSPAGSLAAEAEEAGVELTPITTRDVAAAAGAFFDGIAGRPATDPLTGEDGRDPRVIRHRGQVELTAAVAGAVKRPLSSAWAWDQLAATADITPLIGASNALWGYVTNAPKDQPFFGAWR